MRKLILISSLFLLVTSVLLAALLAMSVVDIFLKADFTEPEQTPFNFGGELGVTILFGIALFFGISWLVCAINYFICFFKLIFRRVKPSVKTARALRSAVFITSVTMFFSLITAALLMLIYLYYLPQLKILAIATIALFFVNFILLIVTYCSLKKHLKKTGEFDPKMVI